MVSGGDDDLLANGLVVDPGAPAFASENQAPSIQSLTLADPVVVEHDLATLSGTFSDSDIGDTHEVTIGWGDGSSPTVVRLSNGERSFDAAHRYLDNPASGEYVISVTVTDNNGESDTLSTDITVNNVAPSSISFQNVTFGQAIPEASIGGVPGQTLSFAGKFEDAGILDAHSAQVDWGDGTGTHPLDLAFDAGVGSLDGSHIYKAPGNFTATVTLMDDDGGVATKNIEIIVAPIALLPDPWEPHSRTALMIGGTVGKDVIGVRDGSTPESIIVNFASAQLFFDANGIPERVDKLTAVFRPGGAGGYEGEYTYRANGVVQHVAVEVFDPVGGITRIFAYGQKGRDTIALDPRLEIPAVVDGGRGADILSGGAAADVLLGDAGTDILNGGTRPRCADRRGRCGRRLGW